MVYIRVIFLTQRLFVPQSFCADMRALQMSTLLLLLLLLPW